ncbi:MAG TPA: hypothetical protein VN258_07700 [Mobilitalea sp.]|nr:hypothetical protein [Mobilitalea sp.]
MADQEILHTAEIVKAALPYIDGRYKVTAELFVKTFDLMGSLKLMNGSNNLSACGFTVGKIDVEGLLNGIRPVCNIREGEIIDKILSFFNMKKMFEMYNNIMETMKTMQEFGGFPFGNTSSDDTDNVMGNFSSENFASIFESLKNASSNETPSDTFPNTDSPVNKAESSDFKSASKSETEKETTSGFGNFGNGSNDMMFELLKTMVPPEQMATFENLSMLLKTMTYDNNSKPDDKERTDV